MSQDIDFEQLIELLDRALASKDPRVISALKKFLFIAALATEEADEKGPFANLVERIERLEQRIATQSFTWYADDWNYGSGTGTGIGTGGCVGGTTTISTPTYTTKWVFNDDDNNVSNFTSSENTSNFTFGIDTTSSNSTQTMIHRVLEDLDKLSKDSEDLQNK